MAFRNPIVGGSTLRRPAIASPNYHSGSTGWSINRDGSAEFNQLAVRGSTTMGGIDLFYDGTPGPGTLVASIAAQAGVDEFGNAYPAGITWSGADGTLRIYDGELFIQDSIGGEFDPGSIVGGGAGRLLVSSGSSDAGMEALLATMWQGVAGHTALDGSEAILSLASKTESTPASVELTGAVVWQDMDGAREIWHTPTMGTGWATGPGISGSYPPLRWRRTAADEVRVFGTFHATSTAPGGVVATGIAPVSLAGLGGVGVAGSASKINAANTSMPMYLNETGALRAAPVVPGVAVGDTFMINATIPMGHLS